MVRLLVKNLKVFWKKKTWNTEKVLSFLNDDFASCFRSVYLWTDFTCVNHILMKLYFVLPGFSPFEAANIIVMISHTDTSNVSSVIYSWWRFSLISPQSQSTNMRWVLRVRLHSFFRWNGSTHSIMIGSVARERAAFSWLPWERFCKKMNSINLFRALTHFSDNYLCARLLMISCRSVW